VFAYILPDNTRKASILRHLESGFCFTKFLPKTVRISKVLSSFCSILHKKAIRIFICKKTPDGLYPSGVLHIFDFLYFVVLPKPPSRHPCASSSCVMPKGRKMPCAKPSPAATERFLPCRFWL